LSGLSFFNFFHERPASLLLRNYLSLLKTFFPLGKQKPKKSTVAFPLKNSKAYLTNGSGTLLEKMLNIA
jgi:hypothetical protein